MGEVAAVNGELDLVVNYLNCTEVRMHRFNGDDGIWRLTESHPRVRKFTPYSLLSYV